MTESTAEAPIVSVVMLAYNHERFIRQAVDSVLAQSLRGRIELLIGEDASTDGTRAICETLQSAHPETIHLYANDQNVGFHKNFSRLWTSARGKYVALLEGDDYWTDDDKLSRQVELLEKHPDWSGCFHRVAVVDRSGPPSSVVYPSGAIPPVVDVHLILKGNCIPNGSVVYRRGLVSDLPQWSATLPMADWPLHLLHAVKGPFGFLDEVMGAYRQHSSGVWSLKPASVRWRAMFAMYDALEASADEPLRSLAAEARRARLRSVLESDVAYLETIQRRWRMLQLDHVSALFRRARDFWNGLRQRLP